MTAYIPAADQVIEDAITVLTAQGHTTETDVNQVTGGLCLGGALDWAAGYYSLTTRVADRLVMSRPVFRTVHDAPLELEAAYREAALRTAQQLLTAFSRLPTRMNAVSWIIDWNDTRCTGAEDAILILKKALHAHPGD